MNSKTREKQKTNAHVGTPPDPLKHGPAVRVFLTSRHRIAFLISGPLQSLTPVSVQKQSMRLVPGRGQFSSCVDFQRASGKKKRLTGR